MITLVITQAIVFPSSKLTTMSTISKYDSTGFTITTLIINHDNITTIKHLHYILSINYKISQL